MESLGVGALNVIVDVLRHPGAGWTRGCGRPCGD